MIEKLARWAPGHVQLLTVNVTGMCISIFAMVAGQSLPKLPLVLAHCISAAKVPALRAKLST